ncbi:MAG TPA: SIS domain-containing protein [Candidatus Acidoferrales bacterium]|nr:SIS domain-containing protein [Candidatus Acidoferrales bacterium]
MSFEREIREQPDVWESLARSDAAPRLAGALEGEIVLTGSGSSLFAAQLGALALRRRGIGAHALAATEARDDNHAYRERVLVAVSQSGRSVDVLAALDALHPRRTIALTNEVHSPLAERADLTIDIGAGHEVAVPASKSVSCTVAVLLTAASLLGGNRRDPQALIAAARAVRTWLERDDEALVRAAVAIAARHDVAVLGTDYGAPIAREAALKLKEATYLHAEGFEAGEFRHGSAAMLDLTSVIIGIVDRDGAAVVEKPLREAKKSGALRYVIGTESIDGITRLGPIVDDAFNTLAWLTAAQMLALHVARARGIDSDHPRGLTKSIASE